jgi:hypothetical protein
VLGIGWGYIAGDRMLDSNADTKGRRITIDLTPAAVTELDKLRVLTGLTTADLFRYAFTLLRIYVQAKEEGQEVRLVDPKGGGTTTRLELPITVPVKYGDKAHAR